MSDKIDEILETVRTIKGIVQTLANNHLQVMHRLNGIDQRIDDLETTVLNMDLPENNPIKRRLANLTLTSAGE